MQIIKNNHIYLVIMLIVLHNFQVGAAESVVTEVVTTSAQTFFGDVVKELAAAGPYVKVAFRVYSIGQEIRKYNFPAVEEKAHAEELAKQLTFFTAEKELQKCLINNIKSEERNNFGRPVACEGIAKMLAMFGGKNEVDTMTSIYNQYRD